MKDEQSFTQVLQLIGNAMAEIHQSNKNRSPQKIDLLNSHSNSEEEEEQEQENIVFEEISKNSPARKRCPEVSNDVPEMKVVVILHTHSFIHSFSFTIYFFLFYSLTLALPI